MTATAAASRTVLSPRIARDKAGHSLSAFPTRFRRASAVSLATSIVSLTMVGFSAASANAATTTGLRARAAAIASSIERENAQLAAIGTHYLSEHATATRELALATRDQNRIRHLSTQITRDRSAVTHAAIEAYVSAGNEGELGLLFANTPDRISTGHEYLGLATGALTTAVAHLRVEQHTLSVAHTTELNAALSARAASNAVVSDRNAVLSAVANERALLSTVNGSLATLVAQQAAARARAAALAAASSSTATTAAGPPALSAITAAAPSPIPAGSVAQGLAGIRRCESGGDYTRNSGNGYYGAYQFSIGTWEGVGQSGLPSAAPPATQDAAAYRLYLRGGYSAWPECAAILGLG